MDHEKMRRLHGGQKLRTIRCTLAFTGMKEIAVDTWLFKFSKPEGFRYEAGQHCRVTLPSVQSDAPGGNARFLSFASAPNEPDLSFAVRMRETPFKDALRSLDAGDVVRIEMLRKPPSAAFAADTDNLTPRLFVAGGIGVVPAYSMIKALLHSHPACNLIFISINRRAPDTPFLRDLEQLEIAHPGFRYGPVMTQDLNWRRETGKLNGEMLSRYVSDLRHRLVYVAGLEAMVAASVRVLRRAGARKGRIRSEQFGSFAENMTKHKRGSWLQGLIPPAGLVIIALHLAAAVYFSRKATDLVAFNFGSISTAVVAIVAVLMLKFFAIRWFRSR